MRSLRATGLEEKEPIRLASHWLDSSVVLYTISRPPMWTKKLSIGIRTCGSRNGRKCIWKSCWSSRHSWNCQWKKWRCSRGTIQCILEEKPPDESKQRDGQSDDWWVMTNIAASTTSSTQTPRRTRDRRSLASVRGSAVCTSVV